MPIIMQTPWKVTMSPVGPSIEYAVDYKFNVEQNLIANTRNIRVAGPGQAFGVEINDTELTEVYDEIDNIMAMNSLKFIQVDIASNLQVEWEPIEHIEYAFSTRLGSDEFSALWRMRDVSYDDAEAAITAATAIIHSLDPAQAANTFEKIVLVLKEKIERMHDIAYRLGQ